MGVVDGQGSLVCCSPCIAKSLTRLSNWTELNWTDGPDLPAGLGLFERQGSAMAHPGDTDTGTSHSSELFLSRGWWSQFYFWSQPWSVTVLNNFALILPMKSYNSSSISIRWFWSKRNIGEKALTGCPSTLAWICKPVWILLRRWGMFLPHPFLFKENWPCLLCWSVSGPWLCQGDGK